MYVRILCLAALAAHASAFSASPAVPSLRSARHSSVSPAVALAPSLGRAAQRGGALGPLRMQGDPPASASTPLPHIPLPTAAGRPALGVALVAPGREALSPCIA